MGQRVMIFGTAALTAVLLGVIASPVLVLVARDTGGKGGSEACSVDRHTAVSCFGLYTQVRHVTGRLAFRLHRQNHYLHQYRRPGEDPKKSVNFVFFTFFSE
jgi:hypothetical protein